MDEDKATLDDLATWDVLVGRVSGRWNHADLKIKPISTAPGRFAAGARLCAEISDKRRLLVVRSARLSGHAWIVDCGLRSSEEAEALRGAELWVHPSMRPALPEGEFYLDQLFGLRVRTEKGRDLGEIEEVLEGPAHNVYVTPRAMIPGHPDFIISTDFAGKLLIVRDVPGLADDLDDEAENENV